MQKCTKTLWFLVMMCILHMKLLTKIQISTEAENVNTTCKAIIKTEETEEIEAVKQSPCYLEAFLSLSFIISLIFPVPTNVEPSKN